MDSKEAAKQADTVPPIVPQALEGRSEADIERLGTKAQQLLEKSPRITKAFFSMIASVRLYNVAVAAINDECLSRSLGEDSAAIAFILTNSVRKITSKEFERGELSQHIQQHVLEFMAMELTLEEKRDNRVLQDEVETEEARRRQLPVTVGQAFVSPNRYFGLERDRTLLLVGPGRLLKQLTEEAMGVANAHKQTVIRLLDTLKTHTDVSRKANTNQWRFELGFNNWVNFATSRRKVTDLLNRMRHRLRGNRLDLLIVEDLSQAYDPANSLPVQLRGLQAQKTIRRYTDEVGAAVICCLPTEEAPALDDKVWDNLEVYTDLRFVRMDSKDNIEIATRSGDSWLATPETSEDPTNEQEDVQRDRGLPLRGAPECDQPGEGPDTREDHEEAGDNHGVAGGEAGTVSD